MSVEIRPLGVKCNIQCLYCYQHPQRDAEQVSAHYDLLKIKEAVKEEGGPFTIFGGEPLLIPIHDLEDLWSFGFDRYGENALQTNGTLITQQHISLFKKYSVRVGISMDGPDELNDIRWHGTLEATRRSTAKSQAAMERLCAEGLPPSLIVTLHRVNASSERLPTLIEWVKKIHDLGVNKIRLHLLESESPEIRKRFGLTADENIAALVSLRELGDKIGLAFDLFVDMELLVAGEDARRSCVWGACDAYTTHAVRGVESFGQKSNCGRTNKEGIDFVKSQTTGYERYVALYHTPQEHGGCLGCRFFLMCKGQCPGTAIDGDWRNRTEHCEVYKAIFVDIERDLLAKGREPLSLSPRRLAMEQEALRHWSSGHNPSLRRLTEELASAETRSREMQRG